MQLFLFLLNKINQMATTEISSQAKGATSSQYDEGLKDLIRFDTAEAYRRASQNLTRLTDIADPTL